MTRWLSFGAKLLFSRQAFSEILEPTLRDLFDEHREAQEAGRPWKARWVRLRGYGSFWSALAQTPVSAVKGGSCMNRKHWLDLGPSLLVGAGIIVATLITKRAPESGWWVLSGPLLLALAVVSADGWGSRLRGDSALPSRAALILGGAFLLAGSIMTLRDPSLVKTFLPVLGVASWGTLLLRPEDRKACRGI